MSSGSDDEGLDFGAIDSTPSMTLEESNKLHRQKLTAIMASNNKLQKEIRQLRKEGSDNYRVKQIKNLRQQLRESQAIADALTHTLMNKSGMKQDEIGDLYDQILSQPKLAKPNNPVKLKKDVLILQNNTQALERELVATKKMLREYRTGERRMEEHGEVMRSAQPASAPSDSAIASELRQVKLSLDVAQGEIATKDRVISVHRDMCAQLQQENRELKQVKMEFDVMAHAKARAEEELARTREQMLRGAGSTEEYHQDIRELRTKLATLLSVRDKVEAQHAEKVGNLQLGIKKIQDRELQLRGQIQLLKADLKSAQDAVAFYKQSAALAKSKEAAAARTTESDRVWEVQSKLAIVSKELKEKSTELRAAQAQLKGGRSGASEAERALSERIAQLSHDNSRLSAALDAVERRYITHNEEVTRGHGERSALEIKYNALLQEMDQRAQRFQSNQQSMTEMEARCQAAEDQARRAQQNAQEERRALEQERAQTAQAEATVKQLQLALAERARFDGGSGAGAGASADASNTARSHTSSTDDLFGNRPGDAAAQKRLQRMEETHLDHVAKLMKNFEAKERDMLYRIATLQEKLAPGSGNRTHLTYKPGGAGPAARPAAIAAQKPPSKLLESDSDEADDDDDDSLFG